MIDLHCHILPGIDDGPPDYAQALELARLAVFNGIHHAIATPHIHPGTWDNERSGIKHVWRSFQMELERNEIPLTIGMAAEVRVCGELMALLAANRIPFLGTYRGMRVILLEFPHEHIPVGSDALVKWLLKRNILPMIAHPERNKAVIRDLMKIVPFVEMGCLLQVTAGSLAGQFGEFAELRARQMLENGWITVLASDAHNVRHRPPNLADGRDAAAELAGAEMACRLVYDMPAEILGLETMPSHIMHPRLDAHKPFLVD